MMMAFEPALEEMLRRGGFEPDYVADLEALTRLMLVASVSLGGRPNSCRSCRCLAGALLVPACSPRLVHACP